MKQYKYNINTLKKSEKRQSRDLSIKEEDVEAEDWQSRYCMYSNCVHK